MTAAAAAAPSAVGIRARWTCAACGAPATTYQVALVEISRRGMAALILDPPAGWSAERARTLCPKHRKQPPA